MSRPRYTLNECVGDPKEWTYTWDIADDVTLSATCDFCGQDGQRLTYEVERNGETLWICQRCVGRYPVSGILDGERLDLRSTRANIHGLTARQKQKTCQDAIRQVQPALPEVTFSEIVVYFERNLQLSPRYAAPLFAAIAQLEERIDPRIFEVQTRSIAHQDEFGELDEAGKMAVWPALTPQQKRRLGSRGFAPISGMPRPRQRTRRESGLELTRSRMSALSEPANLNLGAEDAIKSNS
ncbi:hypothetical protein VW35_18705 [Devosia soli]|uniref:Uncharacterized protein n=1 Tax=Devosia soli TaxID=361041 RepID=A0A0F5L0S8_9HYPH|nr:hypothetical protein [Devosia soli]KKB75805.1 hypothetical protein VW35_18705 [Devosia soli]